MVQYSLLSIYYPVRIVRFDSYYKLGHGGCFARGVFRGGKEGIFPTICLREQEKCGVREGKMRKPGKILLFMGFSRLSGGKKNEFAPS